MTRRLAALAITLTAAGCGGGASEPTPTSITADDGAKPLVQASNYPLSYFAERIGSPVVEVRLLAPTEEDPAYWRPTVDDVLAMHQADLIVLNGASYEGWLRNVSLPPSRMVVTTEGLEDRLIPLEGETTHSHGLEGDHEHSGTAFTTWLDPTLAAAQAGAIAQALARRWPQYAAHFESRLDELVDELTALDAAAQEAVAGNPELPMLFSHPVYQYLARRYGLNARSVHWEPDQMPDETQWRELAALREELPAQWMIWEDAPLPAIREQLESLGIRSVVFDPCAGISPDGDFLFVMQANLRALRSVFAAEGSPSGG